MYGAERWILAQVRYLDQHRVRPSIINLVDTPGERSAIVSEAQRLGYDAQDFYTGGRFNPLGAFRLARMLRRDGISIVHSHGFKSDVMGLIAGQVAGTRIISTPHGWSKEQDRKLLLYERMSKACFKFFDRVCPLSQSLYNGLLDDGIKQSQMTLVMNGVDIREIDEVPSKTKANGKKRIGYIGQFVQGKALHDLVTAFFRLGRNDCELYLIGDGPCRNEILKRIELPDGQLAVYCPGYTSHRLRDLKSFDVFVLPSLSEGIPRCVMEAHAARVPVIGTDIEGMRVLVKHEQTGLLVPPLDPAALAEAINRILNSPELGAQLAAGGRKLIEDKFSAARMAAEYERLYLSLHHEGHEAHEVTEISPQRR